MAACDCSPRASGRTRRYPFRETPVRKQRKAKTAEAKANAKAKGHVNAVGEHANNMDRARAKGSSRPAETSASRTRAGSRTRGRRKPRRQPARQRRKTRARKQVTHTHTVRIQGRKTRARKQIILAVPYTQL